MRWREIIGERLRQAMPLYARQSSMIKKATPLIPAVPRQQDPITTLAQGIQPIVGQVVQQAIAQDDAEEQRVLQAVQNQAQAQQSETIDDVKSKAKSDKHTARKMIKQQYSAGAK